MKTRSLYSIVSLASEVATLFFAVVTIMHYREQSGSVVFALWCLFPLLLLVVSHVAYFSKKWVYTLPVILLAVLWYAWRDMNLVLGGILSVMLLVYAFVCCAHQRSSPFKKEKHA